MRDTTKIKRNCLICNKDIYLFEKHLKWGKGKYCSVSCRAKAQIKKILIKCKQCGSQFKATPNKIKNGKKYCSIKCAQKAQTGFNSTIKTNGYAIFKKY